MSLKDFKPDDTGFDPRDNDIETEDDLIESSGFQTEINTLKIDKLSNRITIISIIIPCLIGALLIFAYLDIKERVVDVDETKNTQVENISQQLEEKLNALDVKIAKNKYDLDNKIPKISKKQVSIEGQIAKLSGLAASKADVGELKSLGSKLEKQIADNTQQNKSTLKRAESINTNILASVKKNKLQFEKTTTRINGTFKLFKEEFDTRLLELSSYEQELGELRKNASLLDKKFNRIEQESASQSVVDKKISQLKTDVFSQLFKLETQIAALNQKLTANLGRLQKDLDLLIKSSTSKGPQPQINMDTPESDSIDQEPLTQ